MWSLTDVKFAVVSCAIAALLSLGYSGAEYLLPWVTSMEEVSPVVQFIGSALFTLTAMAFLATRLESIQGWENEMVEELTVHQESLVFRVTLVTGYLLLFAAGTMLRLHWPALIGLVAGGAFLWLYLADVVLEIVNNWDEVIDNILSEGGHALRMNAAGGILFLAGGVISLAQYHSLTVPRPMPPPEEESIGERLEQLYDSAKKKLPFTSADEEKQEIEQILSELGQEKFDQWLRELREQHLDPEYRKFLDKLPADPEKFAGKLREEESNSEAENFLKDTWEYLKKKKRELLSEKKEGR